MWADAYEIIKTKYTEDRKGDATTKAKRLVTRMGGADLLKRKKSELSHRPRIDVHSELLEEVTQRASIEADSGVITHQKMKQLKIKKLTRKKMTSIYNRK